jgi:LAS superfamily LD-carboxypeptidase LdcB
MLNYNAIYLFALIPYFSLISIDIPKERLLGKDQNSDHLTQVKGSDFLLEKETYKSFEKMKQEFDSYSRSKNKKVRLVILSAYRSYDHQKRIWEEKFSGKRPMRVSVSGLSEQQIVDLILEFSSMPGISRHHWGTDIDFNSLDNHYFEKDPEGRFLLQWLESNANRFGFCRPYTSFLSRNQKGFQEEKWHWSYKPSSQDYWRGWLQVESSIGFGNDLDFSGSKYSIPKAREYVESISNDCK